MLSVMCPNCRHRFPAPGCCNPAGSVAMQTSGDRFTTGCGGGYGNDFLVPRGYLNGGGGCVINAPTIIHSPTIIQGENDIGFPNSRWTQAGKNPRPQLSTVDTGSRGMGIPAHCQIGTTGSGGVGCCAAVGKKSDNIEGAGNMQSGIFQNPHPMLFPAPSGCQQLPGLETTTTNTTGTAFDFQISEDADWTRTKNPEIPSNSKVIHISNGGNISNLPNASSSGSNSSKTNSGATLIHVNATLQLPPNVAHCTVSITATANTLPNCNRSRNNFNGGGIVETDATFGVGGGYVCDREDNTTPTTPVSWVLPFPWGVNGNTGNTSTDLERLSAAQRVLQTSGWYHEGLSWQQSAALLKNAPVGSWLMRDSSDKRYMYAVSVQTARGPTAVRVHYVCGKFRLDAEPRMAPLMPMFDCPVKMIEHYIEYSKKMSEQKEVWVDHSGQLYSQIYLTKPLLKEVRSLSHIARLAVNRNNISTRELPTPLREYIADYPYTE